MWKTINQYASQQLNWNELSEENEEYLRTVMNKNG